MTRREEGEGEGKHPMERREEGEEKVNRRDPLMEYIINHIPRMKSRLVKMVIENAQIRPKRIP